MANKYVDDVVIGAPFQINDDFVKTLNIQKVVEGKLKQDEIMDEYASVDPYQVPKEKGIYEELETECQMTLETIAMRVFENRERYRAKFEKKKAAQDKYYTEQKEYVKEV
jgi:ethanolamine-phosphate cytidylyltransferase